MTAKFVCRTSSCEGNGLNLEGNADKIATSFFELCPEDITFGSSKSCKAIALVIPCKQRDVKATGKKGWGKIPPDVHCLAHLSILGPATELCLT